jgi:DNA-binding NtrC family response regulator
MSKTVLIIDPSHEFIDLVSYVLNEHNYKTTAANSLSEALQILTRSQFDLIMTEALEQSNPFDFDPHFLAQIQNQATRTPVAICSIYSSIECLQSGDYGLVAILRKPIDLNHLETTIVNLLQPTNT